MKNIFKKFALSACAALMLSSCIEETFPTSGATAEQVGQSPAALEAMVNAIPTALILYGQNYEEAWDHGYPAVMTTLTHMSGDLVIGGEDGYNWFRYWTQNVGLSEEYIPGYQFWYNYYSWIKGCNDVISSLRSVPVESMGPQQRAFLGIALTYRAQFYLDLVRLFEPKEATDPVVKNYTIPEEIKGLSCVIVSENTSEADAANNPRATVEEVYNTVIIPCLLEAEELLAGYQRTVMTMPDVSVVYGVLARAYLERGYAGEAGAYALAAEYARKAINCGYTPLTQEQWEDPTFGFNSATSNNAWMWCLSQTQDQVHNLYSFLAHMSIEENWTNYGKTVGRSINSHLYNSIANDDFRKHSWLDPAFFDFYNYKSCRPDAKTFFLEKYSGTDATKEYGAIKFRPGQGDYQTYSVGNAIDFPLMRVEEMYLIEAEAVGAQNLEQGKQLLTSFMTSFRQPTYFCKSTDLQDFQEDVAKQARVEFWGEGIPFWYKKRLGLGIHLANSNCRFDAHRFELNGVAPWWNIVLPRFENQNNTAVMGFNNPDPTDTVETVIE